MWLSRFSRSHLILQYEITTSKVRDGRNEGSGVESGGASTCQQMKHKQGDSPGSLMSSGMARRVSSPRQMRIPRGKISVGHKRRQRERPHCAFDRATTRPGQRKSHAAEHRAAYKILEEDRSLRHNSTSLARKSQKDHDATEFLRGIEKIQGFRIIFFVSQETSSIKEILVRL